LFLIDDHPGAGRTGLRASGVNIGGFPSRDASEQEAQGRDPRQKRQALDSHRVVDNGFAPDQKSSLSALRAVATVTQRIALPAAGNYR
jgi:hypothetical protein